MKPRRVQVKTLVRVAKVPRKASFTIYGVDKGDEVTLRVSYSEKGGYRDSRTDVFNPKGFSRVDWLARLYLLVFKIGADRFNDKRLRAYIVDSFNAIPTDIFINDWRIITQLAADETPEEKA